MSKIGMLCWDYDAPRGGVGRAFRWLAEALRREGQDVVVFSATMASGGHLGFSATLPFRLQRWIDKHGIETLLVPSGPGGVFLSLKPKRCRVLAMCYHTYAQQARLVPGEAWKRMFVPLERRTLRMADTVLYAAADTRLSLEREYDLSPLKLRKIIPAFPLEEWIAVRHEKEMGLCVCVMRLECRKGIDTLLKAWPEVARRAPDARLVLVGHGTSEIVAKARSMPRVTYHTSLPDTELNLLIGSAQLALCPAFLEGFGLFAAQAMASGTPVLGSDAEGLRNLIIDQETGVLLPLGNASAWTDGIVAALQDHGARASMETRARASMKDRFDQKIAGREWLSLLGASSISEREA
jgi:glycosyltransferase involved in cell wall biosynthesis